MFIKIYKWIQAVSLDVVIGSGLLSLAIARYYQVKLPLSVVTSLMISVWLIYTYDHLTDAGKIGKEAASIRHRFHQQHQKLLKVIFLLFALLGLVVVFLLPPVVIKNGLICATIVLLYFLLLKIPAFWFKELLIAACYTLGVFLGPLSLSQGPLNHFQLLLIPQVLLLALANLIIFSCFDYKQDQQDGHSSLATYLGLAYSRKIGLSILIIGLLVSSVMLLQGDMLLTQEIQLLILLMNLLLLMLLLKEDYFRQHDLYRMIGDGIFFIPSLILFYAG